MRCEQVGRVGWVVELTVKLAEVGVRGDVHQTGLVSCKLYYVLLVVEAVDNCLI